MLKRPLFSLRDLCEIDKIKAKIGRQPGEGLIFPYTRCSHIESAKSGISIETQTEQIKLYCDLLRLRTGKAVRIGYSFADEAVSAFKTRLILRKQGRLLDGVLERGDQVVFTRLDRAFRNLKDMLFTLENWQERGIGVHFIAEQFDLTTPSGRLLCNMLGCIAQWQSEYISERSKEVCARMKARGRLGPGHAAPGYKLKGRKGRKYQVPDPEARKIMAEIVRLHDDLGWNFAKIGQHLEEAEAKAAGKWPLPFLHKTTWGRWRVETLYHAEKTLRARKNGETYTFPLKGRRAFHWATAPATASPSPAPEEPAPPSGPCSS